MPSGKDIIRAALADAPEPFVVPFHSRWSELPQEEQVYSDAAIDHVVRVMRGDYRDKAGRRGRLSPSMLGRCMRESLFTYSGVPKQAEHPDSRDLMDVGSWDHMKWQSEGLSYPFDDPYMPVVEKFILDPTMRFGGSLDGILRDGSMFELKTVYFSVMNKVMEEGPKFEHRKQRVGYWMLSGIKAGSLVYYERGSGNYYEIREDDIEADHQAVDAAMEEVETLNVYIDKDDLPEMLPDCRQKVGKVYRDCPYRKVCPKLHSITEAQAVDQPTEEAA